MTAERHVPPGDGGERDWHGQMTEALMNMAEHRAASLAVDRRGWTDEQWIADAERLMNDLDGSVTSLVNGHVFALLRAASPSRTGDDLRETLAAVLAEHERMLGSATSLPGCSCGAVVPQRTGLLPWHRAHVADALADALADGQEAGC